MCARDDRPSSFLVAYRPRLDSVGEGGTTVRGKGKVMASSVARAPVGNGQRALASGLSPQAPSAFFSFLPTASRSQQRKREEMEAVHERPAWLSL